jgi:predicted SAM-dependent methyltransferase
MRLELGCGERPTEGFVHLDCRKLPGVDIVDDATTLTKIEDGSCDVIRAAHLLEHFSWRQTAEILRVWRRKLAAHGALEIEVPNLRGHIARWQQATTNPGHYEMLVKADAHLVNMIFGDQDYPENCHRTMFTDRTLRHALMRAQFMVTSLQDIGEVLVATAQR